jgi:hypothetical protein
MSETPNPTESPPVRRRRRPGLAAKASGVRPPVRSVNPVEGHYEEYPRQQPTATGECVFTALPSRHGLLPAARAWLAALAGNRVLATLTAGLLALCATVALATIVCGTPHHEHHHFALPATRIAAIPSASTRFSRRRRRAALHRHRPAPFPTQIAYTRVRERPAGGAEPPPQIVVRASVPVVHAAPSEPAGGPPTGGSVEGQTEGGPFSP